MHQPLLTLLYDGGCPLCLREVRFLRGRDQRLNPQEPRLAFVDIDVPDYDPQAHGGVSYREAMGRIHGMRVDGTVLRDVAVFREAYRLVGLGWLYAPTAWPLLRPAVDGAYGFWARWRLRITGRPELDQLCRCRSGQALEPGRQALQSLAQNDAGGCRADADVTAGPLAEEGA